MSVSVSERAPKTSAERAETAPNIVALTRPLPLFRFGATEPAPPPEPEPEPEPELDAPAEAASTLAPRNLQPLGQLLLEDEAVDPGHLLKATVLRRRQDARLGEILLAHGWVTEAALTRALSRQWRTSILDLRATPPDPRLIDAAGADFCLTHGIVPWRRVGGVTWVATSRPEQFQPLIPDLPESFGLVRMLLCAPGQAQEAILAARRITLIRQAEMRVAPAESCRTRNERGAARLAVALAAATLAGAVLAPVAVTAALTVVATLALAAGAALKALTFRAALAREADERAERAALAEARVSPPQMTGPLPVISVMVPLFRESDIASRLVARLERLTYPRELTDILLVVEAGDDMTRRALEQTALPRWMRVVIVPDGPIRTKPRALNYALNFCRGQIVGVWDAEDRPDADQLHKVARHFHFAAPDVACLQGALDFYNPRSNWLARCFTIEYAALFRVMLRGYERLGLVIPLGGTTIFFRRGPLESVGAWDAWNVTEDADLGVRLARHGWRTEVIDTTTDEEANCRPLPWVKQRSRWLKGYAMSWAVAMRDPVGLWRQIGPRRWLALQVQLLGPVLSHLLAPVLWSFWLLTLGLDHPLREGLAGVLGGHGVTALVALFIGSELLNMAIGAHAVRDAKHRHALPWVPTMHLYHPLGCLAAWKAIYEVVAHPFYWDKTVHGVFDATLPQVEPLAEGPAAFLPGAVGLPVLGQIGGKSMAEVAAERGEPERVAPQATEAETAPLLRSGLAS